MRASNAIGLGVFGWLFAGMLRTLRAVHWPLPA
jgi:hypothetical protein